MFVEMLTAYLLRETLSAGSPKSHVQTIFRFFKQYTIHLEVFVDIGFINNSYDFSCLIVKVLCRLSDQDAANWMGWIGI